MSTTPGALEIVREAFGRMRTPVAVDVPPSREERAAAWGRLKAKLVNWSVPTDDPAFTGFDPAKAGSEQSFVFRTNKRRTAQGYLPAMVEVGAQIDPGSNEEARYKVYRKEWDEARAQVIALEAENRRLHDELVGFRFREDQTNREVANLQNDIERQSLQLAAFTAQNVRRLDEKPEPPPIFRAIAPSTKDPRRLGLA